MFGSLIVPADLLNLPKFFGKVDGLTKMDASFFDINPTQANYMDPQLRMLHEVVYETIWDAGEFNKDVLGTNISLAQPVMAHLNDLCLTKY